MRSRSRLSGLQSAAVLNGVVGFGVAQPMYEWARQQVHSLRLEWSGALVVVAVVHLVPVLGLWAIRRRVTSTRPLFDIGLGGLLLASLGWQARAVLFGLALLVADGVAVGLVAAGVAAAALLHWRARRVSALFATYAGALALVLPLQFVWQQAGSDAGTPGHARRSDTVLIVVLDELSLVTLLGVDGQVDAARFPAFAALARRSLWFPQAMANYSQTAFSLPSMLSGHLVDGADASASLRLFEHAPLLDTLGRQGYAVHYASAYLGCPTAVTACINYSDAPLHLNLVARLRLFAARAYFMYAQRASDLYPWLPAHARRREAELLEAWPASGFAAPGHATLLHLLLTHDPYVISAEGATVRSRSGIFQPGRDLSAVERQYEAQIRWVDTVLGHFLAELDGHGANRTTLVVTADHGTCWTPSCEGRLHVRQVEPSLVLVPMFVAGPRVSPGVSHADYQHADFMPTVLRAVGLTEGSVEQPDRGKARRRSFFPEAADWSVDVGMPAQAVPAR